MFSNKPKDAAPAPQAATMPAPAMAAPKRARQLSAPSIISADMVIGDKAEIHGEIFAEDVTVRGKVVGRIRARKVLLATTSHVEGDILHEAFAVESASFFGRNRRHTATTP